MDRAIKVSRGEVIGIGKFKIPRTEKFNYEIQLLSFLSIMEAKDSFISTCIHLHIDGYGKTENEADRNMIKNASFFLSQNFSKLPLEDAWENLRDLFKSDEWSNELWNAYHKVQIILSMQGKTTDNIAELMERLNQLAERVKEFEQKVKNTVCEKEHTVLTGDIIEFAKDLLIVERTQVNYKVA